LSEGTNPLVDESIENAAGNGHSNDFADHFLVI